MYLLALLACAAQPPEVEDLPPERYVLRGASLPGGEAVELEIAGGLIAAIGAPGELDPSLPGEDWSGRWLAPSFIDSHVHLIYYPASEELLDGGVAAAVDLAAPESIFSTDFGALTVIAAGPMVTAIGGYPTQSWGAGGYGLEVEGADAAAAAVEHLAGLGAGAIKLPISGSAVLSDAALAAAVQAAAARGLPTAVHATGDESAYAAAGTGADALAHTPTEALGEAALDAWADGAVISTLAAFGGGAAAVENLSALRARGAAVLYGTDLGNSRDPRIDPEEIALLEEAGLDGAAILAAGTSTPAAFWGLDHLGALAVGRDASLLVLAEDPLETPRALAEPLQVYVRGQPRL